MCTARRATTPRRSSDAGFTLVEAVVGMAVFAVLATATLGAIVRINQLTGSNVRRTAAANLATRQIETVRSLPAQSIPDGLQVSTRTVGGITYTIRQTSRYSAGGSTANLCSSGDSIAYKVVTVQVTWPDMGAVKPVRADTMRSVGVGTGGLDQSTLGTLAVLVSGARGGPSAGVVVTLSPGGTSQTTGDDGCAVFAGLPPGTYVASADMDGWSGVLNTRSATSNNLAVSAATVTRGTLTYDTVRSLEVRLGLPATAAPTVVPADLAMLVGDSFVPDRTYPLCDGALAAACITGTPGTVRGLFPENYTVTLGSCPATASRAAIDLKPVSSTTPVLTVPMGLVTLSVTNPGGHVMVGRSVTATSVDGGCSTVYTTATTDPASALVLPFGTWSIGTGGVTPVVVTLGPGSPAVDVPLMVST